MIFKTLMFSFFLFLSLLLFLFLNIFQLFEIPGEITRKHCFLVSVKSKNFGSGLDRIPAEDAHDRSEPRVFHLGVDRVVQMKMVIHLLYKVTINIIFEVVSKN